MNPDTKGRNLKIIKNMTIMDDIFMSVFFEERPECVEEVLAAILPFKPTVESVHTHYHYTSAKGHEVIFDINAKDKDGKIFDIEIQKRSDGASPRRARYYSSTLDTISLQRGQEYDEIDDTYVIFITEHDIFKDNKPIYSVERHINSKKLFNDGSHIIYLNTAYSGKCTKAIKSLIHDLRCSDPDEIINENLAKRFNEIKSGSAEKEIENMCDLLDEVIKKEGEDKFAEGRTEGIAEGRTEGIAEGRAEGIAEGRAEGIAEGRAEGIAEGRAENSREIAQKLILSGILTDEVIAESCSLTIDEIRELRLSA